MTVRKLNHDIAVERAYGALTDLFLEIQNREQLTLVDRVGILTRMLQATIRFEGRRQRSMWANREMKEGGDRD